MQQSCWENFFIFLHFVKRIMKKNPILRHENIDGYNMYVIRLELYCENLLGLVRLEAQQYKFHSQQNH